MTFHRTGSLRLTLEAKKMLSILHIEKLLERLLAPLMPLPW